jgi:TRAP-type mannitol/chloroaromatic compound transport system substrate-binding protein
MTNILNRRNFLSKGVVAGVATAASATLAAPAIAQELPKLRWRLTSGFPNNLDTIYGGAVVMANALSKITEGKFEIQVFQAGELVPGPQALDAVNANTVEIAHTCGYYFTGKDPTFAIGSTIPFGLNARQQNAWLYHGGGNELYNAFLADYGVVGIPGGATGAQMGGWFRDDIRNLADLKGVKLRPMPRDIMDAAYKAAFELYAEYGEEHPAWAKIYPEWKKFRDESFQWFRVAEYSYDSYNYAAQAAGN